jgi:hypothetical protein
MCDPAKLSVTVATDAVPAPASMLIASAPPSSGSSVLEDI